MNLRLNYLYRDYGNSKARNNIVFRNIDSLSAEEAEKLARAVLIDEMYFVAKTAKLPELFFKEFTYDPDLDHDWHEFDSFEVTEDEITDEHCRDIRTLVDDFQASAKLKYDHFPMQLASSFLAHK